MFICLGQDADLHMAQLMPLPLTVSWSSKSRLVYLSGIGSPGLSQTKGCYIGVRQKLENQSACDILSWYV